MTVSEQLVWAAKPEVSADDAEIDLSFTRGIRTANTNLHKGHEVTKIKPFAKTAEVAEANNIQVIGRAYFNEGARANESEEIRPLVEFMCHKIVDDVIPRHYEREHDSDGNLDLYHAVMGPTVCRMADDILNLRLPLSYLQQYELTCNGINCHNYLDEADKVIAWVKAGLVDNHGRSLDRLIERGLANIASLPDLPWDEAPNVEFVSYESEVLTLRLSFREPTVAQYVLADRSVGNPNQVTWATIRHEGLMTLQGPLLTTGKLWVRGRASFEEGFLYFEFDPNDYIPAPEERDQYEEDGEETP